MKAWYAGTGSIGLILSAICLVFADQMGAPIGLLRVPAGMVVTFYAPGYTFLLAIRPRRFPRNLYSILSIPLSFSLVIVIGVILEATPAGIHSQALSRAISCISLLLLVVSSLRNWKQNCYAWHVAISGYIGRLKLPTLLAVIVLLNSLFLLIALAISNFVLEGPNTQPLVSQGYSSATVLVVGFLITTGIILWRSGRLSKRGMIDNNRDVHGSSRRLHVSLRTLLIAILAGVGTWTSYGIIKASQEIPQPFTELYLSRISTSAAASPTQVEASLDLGINNQEGRAIHYKLRILTGATAQPSLASEREIVLAANERWERVVKVRVGCGDTIEVQLRFAQQQSLYRRVQTRASCTAPTTTPSTMPPTPQPTALAPTVSPAGAVLLKDTFDAPSDLWIERITDQTPPYHPGSVPLSMKRVHHQ